MSKSNRLAIAFYNQMVVFVDTIRKKFADEPKFGTWYDLLCLNQEVPEMKRQLVSAFLQMVYVPHYHMIRARDVQGLQNVAVPDVPGENAMALFHHLFGLFSSSDAEFQSWCFDFVIHLCDLSKLYAEERGILPL